MIDQPTFERLLPRAYEWARAQEELVLARGIPLDVRQLGDAKRIGVKDTARVRVLVVDRIPLPDDEELAEAARQTQIITVTSRGVAIGHAIIIRADAWADRELLLHQLMHVVQCERCGNLKSYVQQYLGNRQNCEKFSIGSFEEEARRIAHEICAGNVAPKMSQA